MPDKVYCYPNSDVLVNKLNIQDSRELFEAEKKLTYIRLKELQDNPVRSVEIGKRNLFCTTPCIHSYADSVFGKFFRQCSEAMNSREQFVRVLAENYGDLNALHPFREGNGRTQREFTRLVCLECGYAFDLSVTTHEEMLKASTLSFDKCDNSLLCSIFSRAVVPRQLYLSRDDNRLRILTSDDLTVESSNDGYDYYSYEEHNHIQFYNEVYR